MDSVGTELMGADLHNGVPVHVPAAALGGADGRVLPLELPALGRLTDSLVRQGVRFGIRATVRTVGGDADDTDNVKTREWGSWLKLKPGAELVMGLVFAVPPQPHGIRVRLDALRVPTGAQVVYTGADRGGYLPPDRQSSVIRLIAPAQLAYGSVFAARLTLTDAGGGQVLQQHERIAVYDTIPPMLGSYRAVLLRDGRVAIQVRAGDEDGGVPEGGVVTRYSFDGGHSWRWQVHAFIEDDFGQPAVFETTIGPFAPGTTLLVGMLARDWAGNTNYRLPEDACIFAAPRHAERLLDAFGVSSPTGNPVFAPEEAARRAAWVHEAQERPALATVRGTLGRSSPAGRFEARRLEELRTVPDSFAKWDVRASAFTPAYCGHVVSDEVSAAPTVLRMRIAPR